MEAAFCRPHEELDAITEEQAKLEEKRQHVYQKGCQLKMQKDQARVEVIRLSTIVASAGENGEATPDIEQLAKTVASIVPGDHPHRGVVVGLLQQVVALLGAGVSVPAPVPTEVVGLNPTASSLLVGVQAGTAGPGTASAAAAGAEPWATSMRKMLDQWEPPDSIQLAGNDIARVCARYA